MMQQMPENHNMPKSWQSTNSHGNLSTHCVHFPTRGYGIHSRLRCTSDVTLPHASFRPELEWQNNQMGWYESNEGEARNGFKLKYQSLYVVGTLYLLN